MPRIRYIIHDYAGLKDVDRTVEATGELAHIILAQYADKQADVGITILETVRSDDTEGASHE